LSNTVAGLHVTCYNLLPEAIMYG